MIRKVVGVLEKLVGYIYGRVYCLTNKNNGKQYVGLTTRSIEERFKEHCKADSLIGRAIRKHGASSFRIEELDCSFSESGLIRSEMYWIKKLGTFGNGYNLTHGGDGVVNFKTVDVVLNDKQKKFVGLVNKENETKVDVNNRDLLMDFVLKNLASIYLTCEKEVDKKKAASLVMKLKPKYLSRFRQIGVVDMEELKRYAV